MEKNWFECRVSYDKVQDNGAIKRITEAYLVEAENFTEAEERITRNMQPYISGDFTVSAVRRRNYDNVIESGEGDYFYRVKLIIITIDEKTAAEKKNNLFLLVQADDLETALYDVKDYMHGSVEDWQFHTITETSILDVYRR
jgi:hypothetical protein